MIFMDCYLDNCKFLTKKKVKHLFWGKGKMPFCKKLNHFLENGYAMDCHSKTCGE